MSWFRHKPRLKNPPKLYPYHTSPIAEKLLKETKLEVTGSKTQNLDKKKKNER